MGIDAVVSIIIVALLLGAGIGAGWASYLTERQWRISEQERADALEELEVGWSRERPETGQFMPIPPPEARVEEAAAEARQEALDALDERWEQEGLEPSVRAQARAELEEKITTSGLL